MDQLLKKTCKVKPTYDQCMTCMDIQIEDGKIFDCAECPIAEENTYELLSVGTNFWAGDYAMVLKDGKIERVSLKRVYDVKDKIRPVSISCSVPL